MTQKASPLSIVHLYKKEKSNSIKSGKQKQAKQPTNGGQLLSKPGFNTTMVVVQVEQA